MIPDMQRLVIPNDADIVGAKTAAIIYRTTVFT
jgi:hypothetical protein